MKGKNSKIYIGTSGWSYSHWQGIFYPENIKSKDYLSYYAQHFQTVEINSSFYHLPRENTFKNWALKVPKDFLFAVKVWRRITHLKKLKDIKKDLKIFFERASALGEKFGPLLFQFPPSFVAKEENIKRLEQLLKFIRENSWSHSREFAKRHYALEFRHPSWFTPLEISREIKNDKICFRENGVEEKKGYSNSLMGFSDKVYQILKKYNFAFCWADTPIYPYQEVITADYVYIRLHGHEQLYASKYTKKQLLDYAQKVKNLAKSGKTVYLYFDNDAYGYAIENTKELKKMLNLDLH